MRVLGKCAYELQMGITNFINKLKGNGGEGSPVTYSVAELGIEPKLFGRAALEVISVLEDAGYEAYIVGGGVRDILAGYKPKDFDVATDATPEQIKAVTRRAFIIGRRFRLVHVRIGRELVEVATFRAKPERKWKRTSSAGMLRRDNKFGSISSDATRRDFTINAMFYSPSKQLIIDYCGGVNDIQAKKIKIIGDPDERFIEDPVRMLRAVRMSAKLGFIIEPATATSLAKNRDLLKPISPERMYLECVKLFYNGHACKSWKKLQETQMFDLLFPELVEVDLAHKSFAYQFLTASLTATDKRYNAGKTLSTAYLFAVFLWPVVLHYLASGQSRQSYRNRLKSIGHKVLSHQMQAVSPPKKIVYDTEVIWQMQALMVTRKREDASYVFKHKRFRAALDFLLLRAQAGDGKVFELAAWWDKLSTSEPEQADKMLAELPSRQDIP